MSDTAKPDRDALPYRPCVGVMLLNRQGLIFAGTRIDTIAEAWQMPQGGIDPGETPSAAALRELGEETGVAPDHVAVLRESTTWIPSDLPDELLGKIWNGRFRGQEQRWFAMRLEAGDDAINIETEHAEFREWAWMAPDVLIESIVPFKRRTYEQVFDEFRDLLG